MGFVKRKNNTRIKRTPIPQRKPADYYSVYQNNIFDHIATGTGHSVVVASPGSGKSATIVEGTFHVSPEEEIICVAYNEKIATKLTLEVPAGTKARTFHKIGFDIVKNNWHHLYDLSGRNAIDKDDLGSLSLISKLVGMSDKTLKLREALLWAVKMSKTMLADTVEQIEKVCCNFGIPTCGIANTDFAEIVKKILDTTKLAPLIVNGTRVISFDDMLWLPYVHGWMPQKFDRVFVDEAQDLSASRISLVLKLLKDDGRLCAVGDPFQGIYSWAGATDDIIDVVINDMKAIQLPLSVSYRCPKLVVELAKEINPDIMAAPSAIDGTILHITPDDLYKKIVPGKSVVLSRNNFTLISTAFDLIKKGIKASIVGKDIGNRFIWRIDNWAPESVPQLKRSINSWREEYGERAPKNKSRINDEADSILKFVNESNTVDEVKSSIREFFSEKQDDQIKLSTAHKAKGLEWDHVFMLENTFRPGTSKEEDNINYVAITRAKQSLTFVR